MYGDDPLDEFVWLEDQERGVEQSIANLRAEIESYERQLAALRSQRANAGLITTSKNQPKSQYRRK